MRGGDSIRSAAPGATATRPATNWRVALNPKRALVALMILGGVALQTSYAQERDRPARRSADRPREQVGQATESRAGAVSTPRLRRLQERMAQESPLRPSPQDAAPLKPGEDQDLLGFARAKLPDVFTALNEIRARDPKAYRNRLQEMLPRLRMLRRTFVENPQRAGWIVQHIQNMERLQRARRLWRQNENNPNGRQRIRMEAQRMLTENMRIEARVLDDRVSELKRERTNLAAEERERLLADKADLSQEPALIAKMVTEIHDARDERQRAGLEDVLMEMLLEKVDQHLASLERRAATFRSGAPAELEARLEQLFSTAPPAFAAPEGAERP